MISKPTMSFVLVAIVFLMMFHHANTAGQWQARFKNGDLSLRDLEESDLTQNLDKRIVESPMETQKRFDIQVSNAVERAEGYEGNRVEEVSLRDQEDLKQDEGEAVVESPMKRMKNTYCSLIDGEEQCVTFE